MDSPIPEGKKKKSTILNHAKGKKKNRLDNCFCQDSVY